MPFELSLTTWWMLLGVLVGFVAFWLLDSVFRRDGDAAAQREQREIRKLRQQLVELEAEKTSTQTKLSDRTAEAKRLTVLSEELRDSVRDQDQKITNLETALAAAREQQQEDETLREQFDALQSAHQRLQRDFNDKSQASTRLNEEMRRARSALGDAEQQLLRLRSELQQSQQLQQTQRAVPVAPQAGAASAPASEPDPATAAPAAEQSSTDSAPVPSPGPASSLASRHGGQTAAQSSTDNAEQKRGLLNRLRGAFSARPSDSRD